MRKRLANILLCIVVFFFGLILLELPLHALISTWGGTAIGPLLIWKGWKEIVLLGLVPIVALFLLLRADVFKALWQRWINRLILAYVLLHIALAVLLPSSGLSLWAGLAFNLRFLAMFLLAQLIIASGHHIGHWFKKTLVPFLFITTIVLSVMAILQVTFLPADFLAQFGYNKNTTIAPYVLIDQNQEALRAFATMRGPNTLGAFLLLPLALAIAMVADERRNVLAGVALGLGAVGLALTGSRSAWLGAAVMLVALAVLWFKPKRLLKWSAIGILPAALVVVIVAALVNSVPALRLAIFHSSPGDSSLIEGSSEKHWQASLDGARDAVAHPLGQGVGSAGPASFYSDHPKISENYFVQIAQEAGLVGLGLFLAINALLVWQLWQSRHDLWPKLLLASLAGLTVINIFLHGWADDPTAMTWWAVAGLYLFNGSTSIKRGNLGKR